MKRRKIVTVLIVAIIAVGISANAAGKEAPKKQTTCPVMVGNKINKSLYADVKGKRIYVCCTGCIAQIKADPDKYIKQLEIQGVLLDKTPNKE